MRYVGGMDETGDAIDVKDPLAARLRALSDGATTPADKVTALLSVAEVFPASFSSLQGALASAYAGLVAQGAKASVEALAAARVR